MVVSGDLICFDLYLYFSSANKNVSLLITLLTGSDHDNYEDLGIEESLIHLLDVTNVQRFGKLLKWIFPF